MGYPCVCRRHIGYPSLRGHALGAHHYVYIIEDAPNPKIRHHGLTPEHGLGEPSDKPNKNENPNPKEARSCVYICFGHKPEPTPYAHDYHDPENNFLILRHILTICLQPARVVIFSQRFHFFIPATLTIGSIIQRFFVALTREANPLTSYIHISGGSGFSQ